MNAGNLWFFLKILPLLVLTAALFAYLGWWLRHKFHAPAATAAPAKAAVPDDLPARERVKKLEHSLAKSQEAQKALQQEIETVRAKSISKAVHEKTAHELTEAQHRLDGDQKRIAAMETELKRTRDSLSALNSKNTEANKGQRERAFALENELSKVRGELAALQSRPDNTLHLQTEVDRLREALANANRVVGELRKQEAAAAQSLEKAQKQLANALSKAEPEAPPAIVALAAAFPAAPDRTAEAKAELERIEALNARKAADSFAAEQARLKAEHEAILAAAEKAAAEKAAAEKAAAEAAAEEATAEDLIAANVIEEAATETIPAPAVSSATVQVELFPAAPAANPPNA